MRRHRSALVALEVVTMIVLLLGPATVGSVHAQMVTRSSYITDVVEKCSTPDTSPLTAICACSADATSCIRPQDELSRLVDRDTTKNLVTYLEILISSIARETPKIADDHFRFVWLGKNGDGKPVTRHLLFHRGDDAPSATLPGVKATASTAFNDRRYLDVLVGFVPKSGSVSDAPSLASFYASTKTDNPLLAQVPDVVSKMSILEAIATRGGAATLLKAPIAPPAAAGGPPPAPPPPPGASAVLRLYGPELPHARAEIAIRDVVVEPFSSERLTADLKELSGELALSAGRVSKCATNLSAAYLSVIPKTVAASTRCSAVTDPTSRDAIACRAAINDALDAVRQQTVTNANSCPADSGGIGSDPVAAVDDAFRAHVKSFGSTVVQGDDALKNIPRDRVSFGLMTSVRFGTATFEDTRVKVGDDNLVHVDPLPRLVNAVVVNWHPWGFDKSKIVTLKDPGSITVSAGTTFSPDFGLMLAAGYAPLKGLSINIGYAIFMINAPADATVVIGQAPPANRQDDPFKNAFARSWVWGLTYSFK